MKALWIIISIAFIASCGTVTVNDLQEVQESNIEINLYDSSRKYLKIGDVIKSINYLKYSVLEGNPLSVKLYDSINPIKKRLIGTQIRCKDGTASHSRHRSGTCSHHGGVKDWAEPVYEEYRQY